MSGGFSLQAGEHDCGSRKEFRPELGNGLATQLVGISLDGFVVDPLILMPRDKHRLPKVTAMIDFLFEKFASAPWRQRQPPRPAVRRRKVSARR